MDKEDLASYPGLNVLIVDDQVLVHNTLKSALTDLGVRNIKYAENAYFALRLCEKTHFHIVICAFNVQSDKDGFHLLEEMKFKGYVTKRTVLIFLSADTEETTVNSIVELQPDDFWVKPLSIGHIQKRLAYTLDVKQTLFNVYQAIDLRDFSKAIYCVERHLLNKKLAKYHLNLMRMKGECLLDLLEYVDAETFFSGLLEQHKLSWVYIGYARALIKQGKIDDIQDLLIDLQARNDTRFATYDLLAQYYIEQEDFERAYEEIQKAAALSPRNIVRNKKIWDLARLVHDHRGQFKATQAMAKFAKNSIHDTPDLTLNVIRSGIDFASTLPEDASQKIIQQTEKYIEDLESSQHDISNLKEQMVIIQARLHNIKDQRELAERIIDTHVSLKPHPSLEDNLDKVKVFHELGRREDALMLLESIKNQIGGNNLASQVVSRYVERETEQRSEIHFSAKQLNSMASEFYKSNRYDSALQSLSQALQLTPKNIRVMLNIIKVLIVIHEQDGLDTDQKEMLESMFGVLDKSALNEGQQQILANAKSKLSSVIENTH